MTGALPPMIVYLHMAKTLSNKLFRGSHGACYLNK